MKKQFFYLLILISIFCYNNAQAQGFFGLFNDYVLNNQKLSDLKLVILNEKQISPSSIIEWGLKATTKKGKEIATVNLPDGKYTYNSDITFESDNALFINGTEIIVKPINELSGNMIHIKITMKNKSEAPVVATAVLTINFEGQAIGDYSGKRGKAAQNGSNGSSGGKIFGVTTQPSSGSNGGSNAEYGEDGKSLDAFAKVEAIDGVEYLRVTVQNNSDGLKKYYQVKAGKGNILLNNRGGAGGKGGDGGNGGDGTNGGDGGDGNDGGNGGVIILHIDPSAKPYEQTIKTDVSGGKGGAGGYGGSARQAQGSSYYNNGKNGRSGRMGRTGKIEFKYENVVNAWY